MTFRQRLMFLTAAAIAVTVSGASLAVWVIAKHELYSQLDQTLIFQARSSVPFGGRMTEVIHPDGTVSGLPLPVSRRAQQVATGSEPSYYTNIRISDVPFREVVLSGDPSGAVLTIAPLQPTQHALARIRFWILLIGGTSIAVAAALAAFVAALHGVDPGEGPPPGEHNVFRGEPITRRDEWTRSAIAVLDDSIDADSVIAVWESTLRAPAWERAPVWIHGDLDSRNLLVEHGRLSAVIDWGLVGVGDPACDVMVAWKLHSPVARDSFREALPTDDATWERARGWAVSQAVGALAYYTPENNPSLYAEAEAWLAIALSKDG